LSILPLRSARDRFPRLDARFRRHLLIDRRQIELRGRELLQQRLAPHFQFLRSHTQVVEAGTRFLDGLLTLHALLVHGAHQVLGAFQRFTCHGQLLFDLHAQLELGLELRFQRLQRLLAVGELLREQVTALTGTAPAGCASDPGRQRWTAAPSAATPP